MEWCIFLCFQSFLTLIKTRSQRNEKWKFAKRNTRSQKNIYQLVFNLEIRVSKGIPFMKDYFIIEAISVVMVK